MFTGIIRDIGEITSIKEGNGDLNLSIKTALELNNISRGDSICCSGVCLTIINYKRDIFKVELSKETLAISNAKLWSKGTILNLEKSLLLGDQLGGHVVTGHVDGIAKLIKKENIKGSVKLDFRISKALQKYIVKKGSISIDGVSLTINEINNGLFSVNIISHTYKNTTLGKLSINDKVNIEVDNIARYAVNAVKNFIKEK